ncbi:Two component system response regulator/histidine kinase, CheB domain-containing and DUF4388 [Desulfonema limicola]|uniref:protein-glutamate methylesterase n=1 Tax=Desulfonema limicola TaxID=45656 RepID=A0A975B3V2_9BACT|nr:response regulator [Desulfonema limicola]QTA78305.1 Two component system response regulator/histidine kinase, CheB domain-containing and DUF4388 [Desulfonema limicola]
MGQSEEKVLIVDDDLVMLELLESGLAADHEIYETLSASSAREAIDILERVHISLVVSDVKMPVMSGLDLLAKIREKYPNTKVILITADDSQKLHNDIKKSGCHFFQKPIKMNLLRDLINRELFVKEENGFAGTLNNIQLPDLIQMCCYSSISTAIRVYMGNQSGTIYIEDGEIIHAECQGEEGLEAFYKVFSWRSGRFENLGDIVMPKTTIDKNWQYLLMEGHRQMDEAEALRRDEEEISLPDNKAPFLNSSDILRILIVDDSPMMCKILTDMLSADKNIEVAGTAVNGEDALKKIDDLQPDLITLDVNMPVMCGSTALKHIMIKNPCPVVIVSAMNNEAKTGVLDFLLLGAVDFIQKPVRTMDMEIQQKRLITSVCNAAGAKISNFRRTRVAKQVTDKKKLPQKQSSSLVVICSGAGGYAELFKIIPVIPDIQSCIVVLQEMFPSFQSPLSESLNQKSRINVKALQDKAALIDSQCYVALNNVSLGLKNTSQGYFLEPEEDITKIDFSDHMPDNFLKAASDIFSDRLKVILLSGANIGTMEGLAYVKKHQGIIIAQQPDSCLIPYPLEKAAAKGLITSEADIKEVINIIKR